MSQICITLKQLAFLKFHLMVISLRHLHAQSWQENYSSARIVSVKVLTFPVAAEPILRAIKHL